MDFENLVSTTKPVFDALVRAGIIIDDKQAIIGQPSYQTQRIPRKEGDKQRTEILIEDAE